MDVGITAIGTILNVGGSVLLAIRVKMLLKWIGLTLDAHEMSIASLGEIIQNGVQKTPLITGMNEQLGKINDNEGQKLLVGGSFLIFIGAICQIVGIYLKLA